MKTILLWSWTGFRAGIVTAFAAGVLLHIVLLGTFGHLFVTPVDYVVPPLLFAAHLSVILCAFGLAAGLFWGTVSGARGRSPTPEEREALCAATCIPGAAGFFALIWIAIGVFPDLDIRTLAASIAVFIGCAVLLWILSRSNFRSGMRSAVPSSRLAIALAVLAATVSLLGGRISTEHLCARPQEIVGIHSGGAEDAGERTPAEAQDVNVEERAPATNLLNVLLITVDTLRADHLGCYGYSGNTGPAVDSLAASGLLFAKTYAQRPKTSPSFASILTGTYPQRHGVRGVRRMLPGSAYTLAAALHDSGYRTCGVVTNGNLFPAFKFDQGFDEYFYGHTMAEEGTEIARRWLLEGGAAPFFLWVHHTDPHTPYTPPAPYDRLFTGEKAFDKKPLTKIKRRALRGVLPNKIIEGPLDLDYYIAQYDGEVAYTDHHIGALLSDLRDLGIAENTLVIFTADHGESLGDHNYYFQHGVFAYEPSARIPLIFSRPGDITASIDNGRIVESVDIMPTILELSGLEIPPTCQGVSRAAVVRGRGREDRREGRQSAYVEAGYSHHYGPGLTFALVDGRYKLVVRDSAWTIHPRHIKEFFYGIVAFVDSGAATDELYDLLEDPEEKTNLIKARPDVAASLEAELESLLGRLEKAGRLPKDAGRQALDERTLKSLRALGYVR